MFLWLTSEMGTWFSSEGFLSRTRYCVISHEILGEENLTTEFDGLYWFCRALIRSGAGSRWNRSCRWRELALQKDTPRSSWIDNLFFLRSW